MKSTIGRFLPFIVFLILAFSIADIILTYKNLKTVHTNDQIVDQTHRTNEQLDMLLATLVDAETGQRGYLLTGDKDFLSPYSTATSKVGKQFQTIKNDFRTAPKQLRRLSTLKKVTDERLTLLQQGIDVRNNEGFAAVQSFVGEKQGKEKMDQARTIIESMKNDQEQLLDEQRKEAEIGYQNVLITSAVTGFFNIFFILLALYMTRREFRKRNELEKNKDEFINMASHELKTPITSLKVFTQVLLRKLDDKNIADAKRYLSKIDAQTNKLVVLISDLLDLTRIETGKMKFEKEQFNIDALMDEAVEEVQGTTKKHDIIVKGNVSQTILGDRYRIYQVLINLLTNAVKYSPEGGKIIVFSEKKNDSVIIGVKDSGIGIDKQFQNRIFERLYQVSGPKEKTFPGLGIGLFVTKEIIRNHGGKIWVESEKGKGSTFFFKLPLKESL